MTAPTPDMTGVFSIDDYEQQYAAEMAAASQLNKGKGKGKGKEGSILQTNASTSSSQHPDGAASNAPNQTPIALSTVRTSAKTVRLFQLCQEYAIEQPEYEQPSDGNGKWRGWMKVAGQEIEAEGPYATKKEAKEATSVKGVDLLERMIKEGTLVKKRKAEKGPPVQEKEKRDENEENWVGTLIEYQNSLSAPQPTYTEYTLNQRFSCECTLADISQTFGSKTNFFSSKKFARQQAAKEAVLWLRNEGLLVKDENAKGGIRKKKKTNAMTAGDRVNAVKDGTLVDPAAEITANCKTAEPVSGNTENSVVNNPSLDDNMDIDSVPQNPLPLIPGLAKSLSFPTPEYRFKESLDAEGKGTGFWTVSCLFKGMGEHEGPIGEVRHIFGRPAARLECGKEVWKYLMEVKKNRIEWGRKMMGEGGGVEKEDIIAGNPNVKEESVGDGEVKEDLEICDFQVDEVKKGADEGDKMEM